MNLINAKDVEKSDRPGPVNRIIAKAKAEADEPLYTLVEAAAKVGVHPDTLRRISRADKIDGPSKAWARGKMVIYFYTEDDIKKLDEYIKGKREK